MRKKIIFAVVVVLAIIGVVLMLTKIKKPTPTNQNGSPTVKSNQPSPAPSFDKSKYSINDPTSLWVVVNKPRALNPLTYAPNDLTAVGNGQLMRKVAADELSQLFTGAKTAGYTLVAESGYRSYYTQVTVYNNEVKSFGQAKADSESAHPGHSEHQTGWAVDIGKSGCFEDCFGQTIAAQWLLANAYKYGFILRYPSDKATITGYRNEPWHFRYVGVELSTEMHNTSVTTLEEFFNVPG